MFTNIHVQIWDKKLTWIPHIQEIKNKTSDIARKARAFQGKNWGQNHHIQKILYHAVAEKIVLYAAAVWAQPMGGRKIKHLTSLQRPFSLNLCKVYRTTATSSATVLAGLIPLHIRAEQEAVYTTLIYLRKDATFGNITYSPLQFQSPGNTLHTHPARKDTGIRINISRIQPLSMTRVSRDTQIYTDGSKQEDGVGSAFAHYDKGRIIHVWKSRFWKNALT
ncbi:uncharacterized protein LOC118184635 [Stegodyphus dumicola]|uniref:uncharacterized protein LOC118184635 n=1 Tax=Stegodyphus dumicola TaxID=202533 RepID=UPI0015AECF45|nr:uncharacterized protein LOC118184635 [Stegodyphus dumicola]